MRTLALLLAAAPLAAQGGPERITLPGDNPAVFNLAGRMRVEPGSGRAVVVEVVRGGSDQARLRVDQGTIDGRSTLRVFAPGDRVRYPNMGRGSRTALRVRDDGTFGGGGPRAGRQVTVTSGGSGLEAYADLRVLVPAGAQLSVHQGVGGVQVSNVNGRLEVRTQSAGVNTAGTRGELDIDVGSGSVRVDRAAGPLRIDTGSGSIDVRDVAGDIELDTGSGSVRMVGVRGQRGRVDTGSGGVSGTGLAVPDLEVDTGSGSVQIALEGAIRRLLVDTGSGSVALSVPRTTGAVLELDTGSGGIDVDLPVRATRSRRDHLSGQIGDGEGRIEVDTGSGSVRIRGS